MTVIKMFLRSLLCLSFLLGSLEGVTYMGSLMCESGEILTLENSTLPFVTTCYHFVDDHKGGCGYYHPASSYYHPAWTHFAYGVMWNSWCNEFGYASFCFWNETSQHYEELEGTACPVGDESVATIVQDYRAHHRRALRAEGGEMVETKVEYEEFKTVIDGYTTIVMKEVV